MAVAGGAADVGLHDVIATRGEELREGVEAVAPLAGGSAVNHDDERRGLIGLGRGRAVERDFDGRAVETGVAEELGFDEVERIELGVEMGDGFTVDPQFGDGAGGGPGDVGDGAGFGAIEGGGVGGIVGDQFAGLGANDVELGVEAVLDESAAISLESIHSPARGDRAIEEKRLALRGAGLAMGLM